MSISKSLFVAAGLIGLCTQVSAPRDERDFTREQGGMIKQEYIYQEQPRFLNKLIPDQYSYFKTTVELKDSFKAGKKQFGHDALEGVIVLRHKSVMGAAGKTNITDSQSIKLGNALVGEHSHNSSKPLLWIKEAWFKATLNSIFGLQSNDIHFFKIGMLGFQLGRGIALGSEYGSPKDFLATYGQSNDFNIPGILLAGDVESKGFSYAAYVGFLENKGSTPKETLSVLKANQIGRESAPWAGTDNNNTVYALAATLKPIDSENLAIALTPYIMYNRAKGQTFDRQLDSESHLKTLGAHVVVQQNKAWGIDCEAAVNMGDTSFQKIDRNDVTDSQVGKNLVGTYTHIQQWNGSAYVAAEQSTELKTALAANRHLVNDEVFHVTVDGVDTTFKSASNRVRPAYTNTYAGFMGVVDGFYRLNTLNLVLSGALGYVSGDADPNAVEANKTYKGFVAMHEFYTGKYVKSAFMFDSRSVKRPLSFQRGDTALEDSSFTDLIFGGYGATWCPESQKSKKLSFNTNGLFFWKEFPSYKVDASSGLPTSEPARSFMGTELNLISSIEPIPHLTFSLKMGMFLPGEYYQDIKGVALPGDLFRQLAAADTQNLGPASSYRLGTDTAFVATVAATCQF